MLCHPTPAWGFKLEGVHWPSAQPPCFPLKFPSVYLCLSFAALGPSVGQSPPPQCPSPSSFSSASLDQGVSQEGKEEGEGEDWEEARSLRHPWTMTSCSS